MNELQQHLQAQRESAILLIQKHNQMLAAALGKSVSEVSVAKTVTSTPAVEQKPAETPVTKIAVKGEVVSLFDYKNDKQVNAEIKDNSGIGCFVFNENDETSMQTWNDTIEQLLADFGSDDALAINRKQMADTIFLTSGKDALFYHKSLNGVMFVTSYVGPEDQYNNAIAEIIKYAEANDLIINVMAQEDRVESLAANGLSTTPIGIWQRIEPIEDFTLAGSKMRRLRYLVSKYKKVGDVKTIEYVPGSTKEVDQTICDVMNEWLELKNANPPFVAEVQKQIMSGHVSSDHRFFLTYRDDKLDNVIVLSRDNLNNGYLMDLEFYAKDMPLGSTEFALTEIIECFKSEGRKVLSLGLTMGTGLYEHENRSQEVHDLFATLKKTEYLDGDANAQYKNKYRPKSVSMHIARPQGCGHKKLNDLMLMLGTG